MLGPCVCILLARCVLALLAFSREQSADLHLWRSEGHVWLNLSPSMNLKKAFGFHRPVLCQLRSMKEWSELVFFKSCTQQER